MRMEFSMPSSGYTSVLFIGLLKPTSGMSVRLSYPLALTVGNPCNHILAKTLSNERNNWSAPSREEGHQMSLLAAGRPNVPIISNRLYSVT